MSDELLTIAFAKLIMASGQMLSMSTGATLGGITGATIGATLSLFAAEYKKLEWPKPILFWGTITGYATLGIIAGGYIDSCILIRCP